MVLWRAWLPPVDWRGTTLLLLACCGQMDSAVQFFRTIKLPAARQMRSLNRPSGRQHLGLLVLILGELHTYCTLAVPLPCLKWALLPCR